MARAQVNDPLERARVAFQPQARPVDTFVQPNVQQQQTGLEGLGKSLSGLTQGLSAFHAREMTAAAAALKAKTKAQAEADEEAGRVAYEQAQTRLSQAVKDGKIPAGASLAFREGYARAQLRTMGADYGAYLRKEFGDNPSLAESPEAYAEWERTVFKQYAADNFAGRPLSDEAIMKEFMPARFNARDDLQRDTIKRNNERIEAEFRSKVQQEASRIADSGITGEALGKALSNIGQDYFKRYPRPEQAKWVNDTLTMTLVAQAIAERDPSVLQAAQHIKAGTGNLAGIAAFRKAKGLAEQKIISMAENDERMAAWRLDRRREEESRALAQEIFSLDPTDKRYDGLLAKLNKLDSKEAKLWQTYRDSRLKLRANPIVPIGLQVNFQTAIARALEVGGAQDVLAAASPYMEKGNINTDMLRTFERAMSASLRYTRSQAKEDPALTAALNSEIGSIKSTAGTDFLGSSFGDSRVQQLVANAQSELRINFYNYVTKFEEDNGKPPERAEAAEWLSVQRKQITEQLLRDKDNNVDPRAEVTPASQLRQIFENLRARASDVPEGAPQYTDAQFQRIIDNWNANQDLRDEIQREVGPTLFAIIAAYANQRKP